MSTDSTSVTAPTALVQPPDPTRPEDRVRFDAWWLDGARRAVVVLAATGEVFSADTLRSDPFSLPEPRHAAHWGALFSAASASGVIRPVGYAASTTPSRRSGVLRLWRGGAPRVSEPAV